MRSKLFSIELLFVCVLTVSAFTRAAEETLPGFDQLKANPELTDPLQYAFSDKKVTTKDEWFSARRPELKRLIQHYMYGYLPAAPEKLEFKTEREDANYLGGKATKREVTIRFGPEGTPPINLLLITPNGKQNIPVFVGISFCGNHTVLDDTSIALSTVWMPNSCKGCVNNAATEASRGTSKVTWPVETIISRGYALATFYCGDLAPDRKDVEEGVRKAYLKPGQAADDPHRFGAVAAWAWGAHRVVDYLVTDTRIDKTKIAVVGHSRLGKASIVAGAFDERIAMIIPLQAGCGGTAPSRGKIGEPVARINKVFPHWFDGAYKWFNEKPEKLPFDQHCLLALCAPRPVLFANAVEDEWANPKGQFDVMKAAEPAYKLLGAEGLASQTMPEVGKLMDSTLGYFIRPGKHAMQPEDWEVFLAFADKQWGKPK
jgi:hypothetical protein